MQKRNRQNSLERRYFPVGDLRVTAGVDGGAGKIVGHAAVFNRRSEDLGGFFEIVAPGAFSQTLLTADVRALINHDPNLILGRTTAGTLRVAEDPTGLAVEIDAPDTQAARDLQISIGRGDITQMSFGFRTISDKWETVDGVDVRTLLAVELFDVSPVTYPAYPDTDVAVRSLEGRHAETEKNAEHTRATTAATTARARALDLAAAEI